MSEESLAARLDRIPGVERVGMSQAEAADYLSATSLSKLVRALIADRTYGNVSVAALLTALEMADARCVCGKPAEHVDADPDSDEWSCRVPDAPR